MKATLLTSIAATTIIAAAHSAHGSLIINGSFEESELNPGSGFIALAGGSTAVTGWTAILGGVDYIGGYWAAADGNRSLDLNNTTFGGVEQSFSTIVGQSYVVTFALSGNMILGPAEKVVEVSAGGSATQFTFDTVLEGATPADPKWKYHEWIFTATDITTTLRFESLSSSAAGPALDHVSVVMFVPAPGTLALLGVCCALGGPRRRRH